MASPVPATSSCVSHCPAPAPRLSDAWRRGPNTSATKKRNEDPMTITKKHLSRRLLLTAAGVASLLPFVSKAAYADAVAAIQKAGVLKAGCQVAQVPWGFTDAGGTLTGFDVELVRLAAADMGVKAEITAVTSANRVPTPLTGQA